MDAFQTDWVLVFIAAMINMVIGSIWYSKWLFGHSWLKLSGMKGKDLKEDKKRKILWSFFVSLVIAYFLSFFELHLGVTNVTDGMLAGFLFWLGFVATTQISGVLWCEMPMKLFAIHTGCKLLSFLVMSGIIAA